jgi:RNA polymerase sigma-70 factor (ECF subfamily)
MQAGPSDAELVERTLRGATEAFHELTTRYYRPVAGFIFKRLGRVDQVDDLVQETFLEAFAAMKSGTRPTAFSSWLFGIAHNRCGKWFRRKTPVLFDPGQAPEPVVEVTEQQLREEHEEQQRIMADLDQHLQTLSPEVRQMLEWKHKDGKTCEEIAQATGRPVGTIKSLLARTYKALREAMGSPET